MNPLTGGSPEIGPKLAASAILAATALSIACSLLASPSGLSARPDEYWPGVAALIAVFLFLIACIVGFYKSHLSHHLGIFAGLIALPWFVLTELSFPRAMNSWVALNGSDDLPGQAELSTFATLRIASVLLIAIAVSCSFLRMLPTRLLWRRLPLCRRTWLAFVVGVLVMAPWFIHSVTPYRTPSVEDGIGSELCIIHVEKRGLSFHEDEVSVFKDGRVSALRDERRLFQYRFQVSPSLGVISETLHERARALARLPGMTSSMKTSSRSLRSWNAEGWYVIVENSQPVGFLSEHQTAPPREVIDLFEELRRIPLIEERPHVFRDICLGFCYSPVAKRIPVDEGRTAREENQRDSQNRHASKRTERRRQLRPLHEITS